jgi:hypothetical protein
MKSVKFTLDCGWITEPTISTIDQVARLQLEARRCGCKFELRNANPYLLGLISLAGLGGVLLVEAERQAEQREDPCRIEEESQLEDLSLF